MNFMRGLLEAVEHIIVGKTEWKRELSEAIRSDNIEAFITCLNRSDVQEELPTVHEWVWNGNEAPFHRAVIKGKLDFVQVMVDKGVDVNSYAILSNHKETALNQAVECGLIEIASYLLEKGKADPNTKNYDTSNSKLSLKALLSTTNKIFNRLGIHLSTSSHFNRAY